MKAIRLALLFSLLAASLVGCGGDEPRPRHPTPPPREPQTVDRMPTPSRTEKATGDMREILLSLSRVHFALDSEELPPPAHDALDQASGKMREHPEVALLIEGPPGTTWPRAGAAVRPGRTT